VRTCYCPGVLSGVNSSFFHALLPSTPDGRFLARVRARVLLSGCPGSLCFCMIHGRRNESFAVEHEQVRELVVGQLGQLGQQRSSEKSSVRIDILITPSCTFDQIESPRTLRHWPAL
jgi:hypothetical protein